MDLKRHIYASCFLLFINPNNPGYLTPELSSLYIITNICLKEGGTRNGAFYCRGPYWDPYLRGGDAGEVRRMVRTQASGG